MTPLLRPAFAALVTLAFLTSCQTAPRPTIVRQVEATKSPVQALVLATDHLANQVNTAQQTTPTIASSPQLSATLDEITHATRAVQGASQRVLRLNSLTPQENAQLQSAISTLNASAAQCGRLGKLLEAQAVRLGSGEDVRDKALESRAWASELGAVVEELQVTTFVVAGR